ncbi:MAG: hypothetical protein AABW72_05950 [archaeon]
MPPIRINLLRRIARKSQRKPLGERISPFARKAGGFFKAVSLPVRAGIRLGYQRYIAAEGRLNAARLALGKTNSRIERLQQFVAEHTDTEIAKRASESAAREFGVKRAAKKVARFARKVSAQQQKIEVKLNPKLVAAEVRLSEAQAIHAYKQRRLDAAKDLWLLKNFRTNWRGKRVAGAKAKADKLERVKTEREAAITTAKERIEAHIKDAGYFQQRIRQREAIRLAQIKTNVERANSELLKLDSRRAKLLRTIDALERKVEARKHREEAAAHSGSEPADSRRAGSERESDDFYEREEGSDREAEERDSFDAGEERGAGREEAAEERDESSRRELERDMPPRERRFEELSEAFIMQFRRNAAEQIGVEVSALRPEIVNFCELITRRINEAEPADFDAALDFLNALGLESEPLEAAQKALRKVYGAEPES